MMMLFLSAAWAACTFQADASSLKKAMADAEAAYADVDVTGFRNASAQVDYLVPCLAEPLGPKTAAQLHRLRGIGYYVAGSIDDATSAMRAARIADPEWVPSLDLFPEGFELRDVYLEQPTSAPAGTKLSRARGGAMWIDGIQQRTRPSDRATLFQVIGEQGTTSTYLMPTQPTPGYPGANTRKDVLLATGAGTLVASGVFYGLASNQSTARFQATDADALSAVQTRTNALVIASATTATAGLVQVALGAIGRRP